MQVERIYIGGLNPPHLTGDDIVKRLKSLDIEIHSVIGKTNKCFLHVTATPKGSNSSALEIISKNYNNVKWKGCRISVAPANPHFLERLEIERNGISLALQHSAMQQQESISPPSDEEKDSVQKIPRRLRIRKKFGDEAYHVDTKPWTVDNWSSFSKAKGKLLNRAKKYIEKTNSIKDPSIKVTPLMHRAVHVRFDSSGAKSQAEVIHSQSSSDAGSDDEVFSTINHNDSDDSGSETSTTEDAAGNGKDEIYSWSDDSDGDSPNDETIASDLVSMEGIGVGNFVTGKEEPLAHRQVSEKEGYQWSSESSSDESSEHITRNRPFKDVSTVDEFAAGLVMEIDDYGNDGDDLAQMEQSAAGSPLYDMQEDVSSNLNVLADLFPDMADTSPAFVGTEVTGEGGTLGKPSSVSISSLGLGGIMPRYDPNDASTQKYEVHEMDGAAKDGSRHSKVEDSNTEDITPAPDETDQGEEATKAEKTAEVSIEEASHVYHQGKLENVFREARSVWQGQGDQPSKKEAEFGGAFSFGFELDKPTVGVASTDNGGKFSFGFDLPTASIKDDGALSKRQKIMNDTCDEEMSVDPSNDAGGSVNERRRQGLRFSMDELKSYHADFFSYNEGERIIKDLSGFRRDGEVKEHWMQERQTLTLDWKRKRKHAMSRIQKKMKFR